MEQKASQTLIIVPSVVAWEMPLGRGVGVPPVVDMGRDVLFSDCRGVEDGRFTTQEGVCAFKIGDASSLRVDGFS
jgi:hypothetical protein